MDQSFTHPSSPMTDREEVEYHHYYPPGVTEVLASGSSAFIGVVDDTTIVKYPMEPGGDKSRLETEYQILTVVGEHPGIISCKGFTDVGLYLERARYGTIYWYLSESDHPTPTLQQRIVWCRQLTEAVEHVHSKGVIHCDIQPTNVLVDEAFHIRLADFQGNYLSNDGKVILTGWSGEPCRYFCPRTDEFLADVRTDLFALGSTIYFIITGHEVFPDIINGQQGWQEQVKSRFEHGNFPLDSHLCETITRKCWECRYDSASEVLRDLEAVERGLISSSLRF